MNGIIIKVDLSSNTGWRKVKLICDNTTVDLGLLDEEECMDLARHFITAIDELGIDVGEIKGRDE